MDKKIGGWWMSAANIIHNRGRLHLAGRIVFFIASKLRMLSSRAVRMIIHLGLV